MKGNSQGKDLSGTKTSNVRRNCKNKSICRKTKYQSNAHQGTKTRDMLVQVFFRKNIKLF